MSDNPEKPWLLGREHNPARKDLPPLKEATDPHPFTVRLFASDAQRLRAMKSKPSDFIRDAVHAALLATDDQA
jgi:hypothetical protein